MTDDKCAHSIGPAGISICYEEVGKASDPALLLITGVGAQLINWPAGFVGKLADAGFRTIRFDIRDAGRSAHMGDAPRPTFAAARSGDFSTVPYTLSEMAEDAIGLLEHLGIERAHVVGASMGGQIAQVAATEFPARVPSLVSMMSTAGAPGVGQPDAVTIGAVFGGPPPLSRPATGLDGCGR